MEFLYSWHEHVFVSKLNNEYFTRQIFNNNFLSGEVSHGSLLQLVSGIFEHGNFLNIDISQGSLATYLRCGGIFKHEFVANLPLSLSAKEF